MIEMPSRRWFLRGLVAAPAVILTNHLMPIKVPKLELQWTAKMLYQGSSEFDAAIYYVPQIPVQFITLRELITKSDAKWSDIMPL